MGKCSARFLSIAVFVAAALLAQGVGAEEWPAPIRLKAISFNPGRGEAPAIPPGLVISPYAEGVRGYYLIQFRGPIEQSWKDQVRATGAELLHYIPEFTFKVRMSPAQARKIEQLGSVAWVGLFHPGYKLSPKLRRDGTQLYTVLIERGANAERAAAAVGTLAGAEVLNREGNILTIAADSRQIEAIARILDVAWIENFLLRKKHNEYGAGHILGANTANSSGYDGSSQTVGVADTGLGGGTASTAHPDILSSRITAIHNWKGSSTSCYNVKDDGAVDVDSGHGTHVAVSVLGDGGPSGEGKGTAPAANLIFQAVENWAAMKGLCRILYPNGYYLVGIPSDIRQLFSQAYGDGARIHSNSWGSDAAGDYTLDSANADDFIWNNQDMLISFSAGNAGTDANFDGVIDNDSIGSPATAKNVLTVGASENDRQTHWECDTNLAYTNCAAQGGQNTIFTYGAAWPFDYPANPIANDPSAGNAQQMAAFSSRGPTDDGRIKPDVVAPGTWVLSGYADLYQQGYDGSPNPQNNAWQYDGWGFPLSQDYKYMGGTSMSNPLTAGAAAVVRDFYQKAHSHSASAALVKATLINSAVDLLDEDNDGVNDNDFPIPNNHEGWGRVNLANATDGSQEFVDDSAGLSTNQSTYYSYSVPGGGSFKVTLVWSDYPSSETASKNLVNDLDLVVTSPASATYRGNVFNGGWSQTGGSADRTNNVENVYVESAAVGTWTVEVKGFNVPNGPQPFALVVDGGSGGTPVDNPPTVTLTNPVEGATVSDVITVTADASDDNGVTQVEFFVDGSSIGVDTTAPYQVSWDTTSASNGGHAVRATATDTAAQTATDTNNVTVDNAPPPSGSMHVGDLEGASTPIGSRFWRATTTITVHDASHNLVTDATVTGTWSGAYSDSGSCTTDSSGQCSITTGNIRNGTSTTFTVGNLSHATLSYQSADNHDLDGDTNGTWITINKPAGGGNQKEK